MNESKTTDMAESGERMIVRRQTKKWKMSE